MLTLIPPSLFLGVCFLLNKFSAQHSSLLDRHPLFSRLIRWELQNAHVAVAFTFYSVALASFVACVYLQSILDTRISTSPIKGLLFIASMFLFARLAVGTWYILGRYKTRGGKYRRNIGQLGQEILILASISLLAISLFQAPLASRAIAKAAQNIGTPPWSVQVDGTVLRVSGEILPGLAKATEEAIRKNAGLSVLALDSPGGIVEEAERAARTVRNHNMATQVNRLCASACTFVFIAGRERILVPPGRLGFHECAPLIWFDECHEWEELAFFKSMGVNKEFVKKWQSVPNKDIWFPTIQELFSAHVITGTEIPPSTPQSPPLVPNEPSGTNE
jgi:hypothetical protein